MLYREGDVSVDRDFARFGSKSYAIGQINSVEVQEEVAPRPILPLLALVIGAFILLAGLGGASVDVGKAMPTLIFGGAIVAWSVWRLRRPRLSTFRLMLRTSSQEGQAYETKDASIIGELRTAIEQAIVERRG